MALNLWKLTKPTSYNPLPTGYIGASNVTSIGDYVVTFYAYSPSNAWLRFSDGVTTIRFTLTPTRTKYTQSYSSKTTPNFWFNDENSKGDIIIDSIELVQKPLPKLTINGIDGFSSGKWTLHQNAVVVDDGTLVLNATGSFQESILDIPLSNLGLKNGDAVTVSINSIASSGYFVIRQFDSSNTQLSNDSLNTATTFVKTITVLPSTSKLRFIFGSSATGTFTFKNPMLNLGSTPAPYSKKTGDKMMLPVPKKNLFNKDTITSGFYIRTTNGTLVADSTASVSDFTLIKPSTFYVFSGVFNASNTPYAWFDVNKNYISGGANVISAITSPSNAYYIRFSLNNTALATQQLEEGTTATSYTPYAVQVNKKPAKPIAKPKTGLSFNGVTDYLQLPSMTMDSIEIECLLTPASGKYSTLFDTRLSGGTLVAEYNNTGVFYQSGGLTFSGVVNGQRTKVKISSSTPFSNAVMLFNGKNNTFLAGTLYKVTCYLNGSIVAQYDFEKPSNIVGNQIIPNAKNLIPSFEDSRWSIHANAKVMGKDVLHLDANGGIQDTWVTIPVVSGKSYKFDITLLNGALLRIYKGDTRSIGSPLVVSSPSIFTIDDSYGGYISVRLSCANSGSFDFIRPQLYQLTGLEGTITGTPQPQNKQAKRQLYSKR